MAYINSKKFGSTVQHYKKENGDISYYITYKDEFNKLKRIKVGDKSQGITEPYCNRKRNEILNKIRLGEDIPIKQKKKDSTTLNSIAEIYFTDKKSAEKRKSKYDFHIKPVFGNTNVNGIKREDILRFRDQILEKWGTVK